MKIKIKQCMVAVFAAFFCFFTTGLLSSTVAANSSDTPTYRIGIAPTQKSLDTIEPGGHYEGSFSVRNSGKEKVGFSIDFSGYGVESETYAPYYDRETKYTDIVDWISVNISEGELEPGTEQKITYSVDVPSDAHGGAQMAAIMVTMVVDEANVNENAIESVQRVGYLVFGNVDGEVTKTGEVLENKIPTFLFNPPIFGTSVVENTGNVYTAAKYTLQVFPLFSDEEVYTNEEKPEDSIIFPETKRFNQISWEGAPHLGIFKVRQTVKIFDEESVTEKIVFLCPIWFLFIVLLLIFCIIFWIVSRAFKRKREA